MKSSIYFSFLLIVLTWASPLLPVALVGNGNNARAASIVSFTLVNADTDTDLFDLTPGMVLDLGTLPTRNLNIRANVDQPAGSVLFAMTGPQTRNSTENIEPYALFSDFQGDYFAWVPPLGSYSLLASPFDGPDGTGDSGAPLTLSFSVINSARSIASFTLVNADTDLDLQTVTPGMTLNLTALPTQNLNIRANPGPGVVGSVTFELTGPQTRSATENVAPYALYSDLAGNYDPWTPVAGTYTLTATPYELENAGGAAGSSLSLSFTVVATTLPVQLTAFVAEPLGATAVQLRWNTAMEEHNREFVVQRSADGRNFIGIARVAGHGTSFVPQSYSYDDKQLPANLTRLYYRLQQVDLDGTSTYSPVRAVAVVPGAAPAQLQAFVPNAVDGLVHYTFSGPATGTEELELYTIMGQRLGRYPLAPGGSGTVPVAGLSAGTYVLHLVNAAGSYAGRFALP
jgi:hypothetical protein